MTPFLKNSVVSVSNYKLGTRKQNSFDPRKGITARCASRKVERYVQNKFELFLAELPSGAPLASWEIKGNP